MIRFRTAVGARQQTLGCKFFVWSLSWLDDAFSGVDHLSDEELILLHR